MELRGWVSIMGHRHKLRWLHLKMRRQMDDLFEICGVAADFDVHAAAADRLKPVPVAECVAVSHHVPNQRHSPGLGIACKRK